MKNLVQRFFLFCLFAAFYGLTMAADIPNNKIYYTSTNGAILNPNNKNAFGANIVSNTYYNGQGIITFDGNVTSIGDRAFYTNGYGNSLTSIIIPNSVTEIGCYAFTYNELTSIIIPNSVTKIGRWAFENCSNLTSVTIGSNVSIIGDENGNGSFWLCPNLCSITVDKNNKVFDSRENCNAIIETSTNELIVGCNNTVIPNSVSSIGQRAFCGTGITNLTIPENVNTIGKYAFEKCRNLTSITIPNSVTNMVDEKSNIVGYGMFSRCSNLAKVVLPNNIKSIGNSMFYECSSLTSIIIPSKVTSIESYAFNGCSKLSSITSLAMTPPTVMEDAFSNYSTLRVMPGCKETYENTEYWKNFTIDENINNIILYTTKNEGIIIPYKPKSLGTSIISNTYENGQGIIMLNEDLKSVGEDAFRGCSNLVSIIIPNSVTSIGEDAFRACSSLLYFTIPNSVTSIGKGAFRDCYGLTNITLSKKLVSIGVNAFNSCYGITDISIPNSVTSIGSGAFENCMNISKINVEVGNTIYDSRENCNAIINSSTNELIHGCKNSIIPNNVTDIGVKAFYNCSGLSNIIIPNSVINIRESAFEGCSKLIKVIIDNGVRNIEEDAFYGCSSLSNVILPESLTNLDKYAFSNCNSLADIIIPKNVTSIGNYVFSNCPELISVTCLATTPPYMGYNPFTIYGTLHVLPGYKSAYENANIWKNFTIVEDAIDPALKMVLTDGMTYNEETTQENKDISYTRTFNNTSWQALYIPFSMTYDDWKEDFEVAYINGIRQMDTDDDGAIDETIMDVVKIKSGSLIPNTPYLIKAKTTGNKTITVNDATLYKAENNSVDCSTTIAKYTFTGTYSTIPASTLLANNYYAMGGGSLIMTDGTSDLKPFRWYLNVESRSPMYNVSSGAKAITINVVGEEEATGISQMSSDREHSSAIYDLNGRKMSQKNMKSGLYIKNGKKIIIK